MFDNMNEYGQNCSNECGDNNNKCQCKKCRKQNKCCVDLILTILVATLTLILGLIIGAITTVTILAQIGAVVAFAVIIALLIILRIIMLVCCNKKCC